MGLVQTSWFHKKNLKGPCTVKFNNQAASQSASRPCNDLHVPPLLVDMQKLQCSLSIAPGQILGFGDRTRGQERA